MIAWQFAAHAHLTVLILCSTRVLLYVQYACTLYVAVCTICMYTVCCCMYSMHVYVSLFLPQRNYQFDFLRKQHPLFAYFTKLVEQYSKVGGWVTAYQCVCVCVCVCACVCMCTSMCVHEESKHGLIGASLSMPHTSMTSLCTCVCLPACLLAPTTLPIIFNQWISLCDVWFSHILMTVIHVCM